MFASKKLTPQLRSTAGLYSLLGLNLLFFVGIHCAYWLGASETAIARTVTLSSSPVQAISHLWTAATYMFVQWDFMHLVFNMVWLWCFGMMAVRMFVSGKQIVTAYISGGLVAALVFIALSWLTNGPASILLGASASVLSVICAIGVMRGRRRIELLFIGSVQVRWLAAGITALVLITSFTDHGMSEICAHASGALTGLIIGLIFNRRPAMTDNPYFGTKLNINPYPRRGSEYGARPRKGLAPAEQAELDDLLDIVRRSGYNALSVNQRIRLFDLSAKIK